MCTRLLACGENIGSEGAAGRGRTVVPDYTVPGYHTSVGIVRPCAQSTRTWHHLDCPCSLPRLSSPQHREHYIDGRRVDAKAAVPRDQGGGKLTRKMFVGGIGEVSDDEFRNHFAVFGTITVRAGGPDSARGCACVLRIAGARMCPPPTTRLMMQLRSLPAAACPPSSSPLLALNPAYALFPALQPQDCVVLRKPDGSSRGFGFVTYDDEMSVEKASGWRLPCVAARCCTAVPRLLLDGPWLAPRTWLHPP